MLSPTDAIKSCLSRFWKFSGRTGRAEFWWFFLTALIVFVVLILIDSALFEVDPVSRTRTCLFAPLFGLASLLPMLTAGWRRMHDAGKPGWFLLLPLPVIIAILAFMMNILMGFPSLHAPSAFPETSTGPHFVQWLMSITVAGAVLLVLALLLLWWLTRPSGTSANKYGPPPAS